MSDGMGRELVYLSSYATNRYFIPNWGNKDTLKTILKLIVAIATAVLSTLGVQAMVY